MASRKLPPIVPSAPSSWMDLLAAATLHDAKTGTIQAEIVADVADAKELRLVVQSYENGKPIGSIQRAVTAAELRKGVHVRVVEVRDLDAEDHGSRVVAWVERGRPDFDVDARPSASCWYGEARGSDVRIVLRKRVARAA